MEVQFLGDKKRGNWSVRNFKGRVEPTIDDLYTQRKTGDGRNRHTVVLDLLMKFILDSSRLVSFHSKKVKVK